MALSLLSRLACRVAQSARTLATLPETLDSLRLAQGRTLVALSHAARVRSLRDSEFRVFSQWGEDGILQYLTRSIPIAHNTFIELGVEDFSESNCRFLMMNDNWAGLVVDASARNIRRLRNSPFFWKYDLQAACAFLTPHNVDAILAARCFDSDVGILSIDIDGNDYYILEAIHSVRPRIIVCEYNAVFGDSRSITVPYDPHFSRTAAHPSNLYFGASLAALTHLANGRGYALVGTNSAGCNAFFVRCDLLNDRVREVAVQDAFTDSRFRESRSVSGDLSFLSGEQRHKHIQGLPVHNVITKYTEPL